MSFSTNLRIGIRTNLQPANLVAIDGKWKSKVVSAISPFFNLDPVGNALNVSGTLPSRSSGRFGIKNPSSTVGALYTTFPTTVVPTVVGTAILFVGKVSVSGTSDWSTSFGENAASGGYFGLKYNDTFVTGELTFSFRGRVGGTVTERGFGYNSVGATEEDIIIAVITSASTIEIYSKGKSVSTTYGTQTATDNPLWSIFAHQAQIKDVSNYPFSTLGSSYLSVGLKNITIQEAISLSINPWQIFSSNSQYPLMSISSITNAPFSPRAPYMKGVLSIKA